VSSSEIDKVACFFRDFKWVRLGLSFETCNIDEGFFGKPGSIIKSSVHLTVKAFAIVDSYKTFYVPVNLHEKFPNLYVAQIEKCSIRHIGNEFQGLNELQVLYLDNNKIRTIDDQAFKDNSKLTFLSLLDNNINYVNPVWFEHLTSLRTLYLDDNDIRYIDPLTFTSLVSIENIDLRSNEISYLDPKTFENLLKLKNFTVAHNHLTVIEKDLFKTNVNLHRVVFDFNNIQFMDPDMFDGRDNMFMVDLKGNPCVSRYFSNNFFDDMKSELKEKCSDESLIQSERVEYEKLKSFAETCDFLWLTCGSC
jgi:hypothetical protein